MQRISAVDDGTRRATWLAVLFPLAIAAFGAVHTPVRLGLVLVGALGLLATEARQARALPPGARRLGVVLTAFLALELISVIPVPSGIRALLQPGVAPYVERAMALVGDPLRPLALEPWKALVGAAVTAMATGLLLAGTRAFEGDRWRRVELVVFSTGAFVVGLHILQRGLHAASIYFVSGIPDPVLKPFFGPFVDGNHAGALCAALVPLGLARGVERQKAVHWLWAILFGAGVLLTASRGGFVAAAMAIFAYVLVLLPNRFSLVALGLAFLAVVLALLDVERSMDLLNAAVDPNTARHVAHGWSDTWGGRKEIYEDVIRLLPMAPALGLGAGGFHDAFLLVKSTPLFVDVGHAHQEILEVAVDHGLVGVGLVLAMVAVLVERVVAMLRTDPGYRIRSEIGGPVGAMTALLTVSMVEFPLRSLGLLVLLVLVTARILSLERIRKAPTGLNPVVPFGVVAFVLALLSVATTASRADVYGPASRALEAGVAAEAEKNWDEAGSWYARAIGRAPLEAEAIRRWGRVQLMKKDGRGLEALKLAAELDPSRYNGWASLAEGLAILGAWPESRAAWRRALAANVPDTVEIDALIDRAMRGPGEALGVALEVLPEGRADRAVELARWLDAHGDQLAAEALYQEAIALDPMRSLDLAWASLGWGVPSLALELALPHKTTCDGARIVGKAYARMGETDEALEALEAAHKRGCGGKGFLDELQAARKVPAEPARRPVKAPDPAPPSTP